MTVLFQDGTGGLEERSREGVWAMVRPLVAVGEGGAVLIQLGDMLEHWTRGRLHATVSVPIE